ncbi:hypothetical protein J4221_03260 [Candidatus Pacearchaeota archaeon]|nr:hypothetical protein [Candidatus Pacearchaeota archaeon]
MVTKKIKKEVESKKPAIILVFTLAMAYFIFWIISFFILSNKNESLQLLVNLMSLLSLFSIIFAIIYIALSILIDSGEPDLIVR